MAKDTVPYPEATDLAGTKSFYPVKIPVTHWQLRHYISAPEADLLYYASGHDVFCLNTATKKRKHVATLPFESRCTASGYGWVCVGGEDCGHFAAIRVNGSGPRTLDVDSALPVDSWRQVGPRNIKVERIGEEIVNSISIHRIQDEDAHLDDIVAVLTNNDKTVRVYSLPQGLETTVLDLPFAMNHATVSPDGQTLVAVGDYNQAYFFCRDILTTPPQIPKPHNRLTSSSIGWTLTNIVDLHIVPRRDPPRGYFTTAWSPSGQLVALGSEGGFITVFDVDMLASPEYEDEDAVVAVVPSSRPDQVQSHAGAVRSMMFSPDPWDLLIWAEDQGRICIADLRTGLRSKQVVNLEPKEVGMKRISYEDVAPSQAVQATTLSRDMDTLEAELLLRHRHASDSTPALNSAAEYIEAMQRQRQQRPQWQDLTSARSGARLSDDQQGLTPSEQQILESLRTTRQREEARANAQTSRTSSNNNSSINRSRNSSTNHAATSLLFGAGGRSSSPTSSSRPADEILSSFPELSRTRAATGSDTRPMSSHGDSSTLPESSWTPSRNSYISRISDGSRLPRRRAIVTDSPPARTSNATSSTTQPRATLHSMEDDDNPWRSEAFVNLTRGLLFEGVARARADAATPPSDTETSADVTAGGLNRARVRPPTRPRDARWRYGSALLERRGPAYTAGDYDAVLSRANFQNAVNTREREGVRTAGLAMSPDGRTLWAACEEGIFEMNLNVKSRMYWPATEPR